VPPLPSCSTSTMSSFRIGSSLHLLNPCFLLAVTCALYIVYEISERFLPPEKDSLFFWW
jgi:hypothetical protein